MTEFEKRVVETSITMDCFKMDDFENITFNYERIISKDFDFLEFFLCHLETLRCKYNETKDKRYLKSLMLLLPNNYRVRKDNIKYEFGEVKHRFIL